LVEKEAHLLDLCRYVVLNPVQAKLVLHPRQWPWNSTRTFVAEGRGGPRPWEQVMGQS
jgi:hypothetical protein